MSIAVIPFQGRGLSVILVWAMPNYQAGPGVDESSYSQSGSWCGQSSGTPCREVPDDSINADKKSGYSIYCTDTTDCNSQGWVKAWGTSAGAPLWAAITVLGDSYYNQRLGLLNPFLYALDSTNIYSTAFHDIIHGNNNQGLFSPGYPAGMDYDMVTGLGTPDIYQLVKLFSSSIHVSPTSVNLTISSGGQLGSQNLTLTNNGTGTLHWSSSWSDSTPPSWVTVSPTSGSLVAATSQQLTLTFNITSTTPQAYSTNLIISDAHANNSPASIPVTVFVSGGAIVTLPDTNGQDACTANTLPSNDDNSSDALALPFTPNFFGYTYNSVFVNNNGYVTFDAPISDYTPYPFDSTSHALIASFFADVDTRGIGSNVVTYGSGTYQGHATFCVDWVNVGYYAFNTDKLNSFQLLLVDRSDRNPGDFDIIMNYNQIQWEIGDASGCSQGLGGTSARVGYTNGNGTFFELPDSGVNGALLDSNNPGGLIYGSQNDSQLGRYIYPVQNTGIAVKGKVSTVRPNPKAKPIPHK